MLGRCPGIGIADCICGGAGRSENTTLHRNAFLVLHFFLLSFLYLMETNFGQSASNRLGFGRCHKNKTYILYPFVPVAGFNMLLLYIAL